MRRIRTAIITLLFLSTGAAALAADAPTTTSGEWEGMLLTILSRTTNSWGQRLQVETGDHNKSSEGRFNLLDCQEKESISFRFKLQTSNGQWGSNETVFICDTPEASESCRRLKPKASGIYDVTIAELFPDLECSRGTGTYYIWLARPNDNNWWLFPQDPSTPPAIIRYDLDPPRTPPTIISAGAGDKKVGLEWESETTSVDVVFYPGRGKEIEDQGTDGDETDVSTDIEADTEPLPDAGVSDGGVADGDAGPTVAASVVQRVLASTAEEEDDEEEDAVEITCPEGGFEAGDAFDLDGDYGSENSKKGGSYELTGLKNGTVYKIGLVAKDSFLNRSAISETVCVMPEESENFWDIYTDAGGKGGKFCFVATAAFGSYDHPMVQLLRGFRDRFLARLPLGEQLILTYYEAGPSLASVVATSGVLRGVSVGLLSVLAVATVPLTLMGPLGTVLFMLCMAGVVVYRRRRRFC